MTTAASEYWARAYLGTDTAGEVLYTEALDVGGSADSVNVLLVVFACTLKGPLQGFDCYLPRLTFTRLFLPMQVWKMFRETCLPKRK